MSALWVEETDTHEYIKTLEENSINLIYTSPPYGITGATWDKPLRWKEMFKEMWRVLKPDGKIILHCSMPFTYELLKYETPRYDYTWVKNNSTNFLNAKKQPLRKHEQIMVYYKKRGTYNPQMTDIGKPPIKGGSVNSQYYGNQTYRVEAKHTGKYPTTVLEYPIRQKNNITRCDDMIKYFIRTYSNEGDTVLDITTCNKIVGNIVKDLGRHFIGVDINKITDL